MPFRDPVPFLILPPGADPPTVGEPAIVLNPIPSPIIQFYTGDSDEDSPGFIQGLTGGGVLPAGSLWLWLAAPLRDDSGTVSTIVLKSGGDAAPNNAEISFDTALMDIDADVEIRSPENLSVLGGSVLVRGFPVTYRIAQTEETSNSGTFSAETVILSVTGALVSGKRYRIDVDTHIDVDTSGDDVHVRVREDNVSGTVQHESARDVPLNNRAEHFRMMFDFVASSTGNKTFVATADVVVGAGVCSRQASSTQPSTITIDCVGDS